MINPGVIAQNPDNRCFLKAVSYRLHDAGPLRDLIKILKRVIATPDTDYVETIDLLRVALRAKLPNVFETFSAFAETQDKIMPALVDTHHQMAHSAAQIVSDQHYQEVL